MATQQANPDVRQLNDQELPGEEFPGGRRQAFRVFIDPATHAEIWKHASTNTNVEICGVLVGQLARDENGPFLIVSASIRGEAATTKFAEVTFTHETWSAINSEMDSKYTDRSIVGWYHTHPDFGIFLSDRDRFIQENFFSGPGQVAFVVDPIRNVEGVFIWRDGKPDLTPHYWVGNRVVASSNGQQASDGKHPSASQAVTPALTTQQNSSTPPSNGWLILQKSLQYVLVFLIGWLLAGRVNDWLLDEARQEGAALAISQFGLRPGLELRLSELQTDLLGIGKVSQRLLDFENQQVEGSKLDSKLREQQQAAWKEMELRLNRSLAVLNRVDRDYCLDDEQRAHLKRILNAQSSRSVQRDNDQGAPPKAKDKGATPGSSQSPSAGVEKDKQAGDEKRQATPKESPNDKSDEPTPKQEKPIDVAP
jgi:proteasome lid subunit RPN8/RPN11